MNYTELLNAVEDAERSRSLFIGQSVRLAALLKGNLRNIGKTYQGQNILRALKKELSEFDSRTGEWKT